MDNSLSRIILKKNSIIKAIFSLLLIVLNVYYCQSQIVDLGCQEEDVAVEDLERKDFETPSGSTAIHSEGSMHNFTLPSASDYGPCKIISNITIVISAFGVDLTNLPPDCIPTPQPFYYNIALGCPDFTPASCPTTNLLGEPNTPTFTNQNFSYNGDFDFGENLSVDIVPVMNINCTAGQTALTSDAVVLDYQICVTVTIEDEAISTPVDLGSDLTVCPTSTTTLDAGSYIEYAWDPNGETTQTIDVGPGNYTVTVTDGNGCTDTDEVSVNQFPDSNITFDPTSPDACDNAQVAVSVNETYPNYLWSNGAITQTTNLAPGTYDVTITDGNSCTAVNSVTINNVVPPNAGIDNNSDVCNDGTTYNIDALLLVHDAGGTWADNDASGLDLNSNATVVDFSAVLPGIYTYTYTVTGTVPCPPDDATITIQVFDQNDAGTSDIVQFCPNPGFLDFNLLIGNPDAGGTWSDINGAGVDLSNPFAVNFDGIGEGTYDFEYLLSANGPCSEQTATLTIVILSSVTAGDDNATTVCEGTQLDLSTLIMGANDIGFFEDTDVSGALTGSIVNTTGLAGFTFNYTYVVGSPGNPCGQDEAVFTVTIETSLSAGDDVNDSFCTGGNIDLFDVLTNEDIGGTFTDVNSSGGLTGNILNTSSIIPGTYLYQYQIGDGVTCPEDNAEISITFFEDPTFSIDPLELFICEEECDSVTIDFTGTPPFSFPIEVYSSTTGDLLASDDITITTNSYTFTACNTVDSIAFSNDTLSLLSDSIWLLTIPTLNDLNCTIIMPSNPDTLSIQTFSTTVFQLDTSACITDTLLIGGVQFFDGNDTYSDTLQGMFCDSIVNINVIFTGADTLIFDPVLCPGDSILIEGLWFNEDIPNAEINIVNPNGCDSLIIIDVSFFPEADSMLNVELCTGDSIVVNGTVYNTSNPSGTEVLMGQSVNGCDSTIEVSLQFSSDIVQTVDDTICPTDSVVVGGIVFNFLSPSGQIILSGSGCDTIIDIDLSFFPPSDSLIQNFVCPDFSIDVNGTTYDIANPFGTEIISNGAQSGCDSIVNIDLVFLTPISFDFTTTICDNESIEINGTTYDINNQSGTEIFIGGAINGCDSTVNVQLIIENSFASNASATICSGDSIFLAGEWQFVAGTYIDSLSSINLCDSIVTTSLSIDICEVSVELTSTNNACTGGNIGSITLTIQSDIEIPFTVVWEGTTTSESGNIVIDSDQNMITISNLFSDEYMISILDSDGNSIYQGSIIVIDSNPPLGGSWAVTDSIFCAGDLGSIEFQATGGAAPYQYNWDPGQIGDVPNATNIEAGMYFLTLTDDNGCTFDSTFTLTEPIALSATLNSLSLSCLASNDGEISISEITGGMSPYTVFVNDVLTDSLTFSELDTGTYVIDIFDSNNCTITFSETLSALDNSIFGTYTENYEIQEGESVTIDGNIVDGNFTLAWTDVDGSLSCLDCPNPVASPLASTSYSLLIVDSLGCSQVINVFVNVLENQIVNVFPNAFSPNGDNSNDEFVFRYLEGPVQGLIMSIYDRWGNLVFTSSTTESLISWDGTRNGKRLNSDVFVYKTIVQFPDGTTQEFIGDLTLIR
ncbi:MAG: gliding motility-associated C-terminal domain-containing protein [Saprospiraceae bacterium]|nr:gliding motility-associated C-terminal domain-containing protein [Saprospiraceae bacterium]